MVIIDKINNFLQVENLFQKYLIESSKYSEKDLSLIIQLSSAYLQSLLYEAEQQNLELHVDINSIENKFYTAFIKIKKNVDFKVR